MTRQQALNLKVGDRVREFGQSIGFAPATVAANGTCVWIDFGSPYRAAGDAESLRVYSHDEIAVIFNMAA